MKNFIKDWLLYTLFLFVCYDGIWIIMEYDEIHDDLEIDHLMFVEDIITCGLLTLSCILIERFVTKKVDMSQLSWKKAIAIYFKVTIPVLTSACLLEYIHVLCFYHHFPNGSWQNLYIFSLLALFSSISHLSIYCYKQLLKQQSTIIEMKQKMLKAQLNPHFIFNSLSILAGLTRFDPKAAEDFTLRLSDIYRYTVNNLDKEFVPVLQAVNFIKQYIKILQVRYPDSIICDVDEMKYGKGECLFSLSLQLLVENAVKHNPPTGEDKLTLHIWRENDCIHVRNNIIDSKRYSIPSNGIGLVNLQEQYRLKGCKLPEISNTRDWFEVKLPIISCS